VPVIVALFLFFFYGYMQTTPIMINRMLALEGLVLLNMSVLLGPLSRLLPKTFSRYLIHRKALGLWGVAFITAHVLLSLQLNYGFDFTALQSAPQGVGIVKGVQALLTQAGMLLGGMLPAKPGLQAGVLAFIVLLAIALASNRLSEKVMGHRKWKILQRLSYLVLLISLAHFYIMESSPAGLAIRPVGIAIFILTGLVLSARLYDFALGKRPEKSAAAIFVLLGIVLAVRALNVVDQNITNWLSVAVALTFGLYALYQKR
jgi:sulfoxide reductase heme-binding subunit YedZ